jgi:hypothetical protein
MAKKSVANVLIIVIIPAYIVMWIAKQVSKYQLQYTK